MKRVLLSMVSMFVFFACTFENEQIVSETELLNSEEEILNDVNFNSFMRIELNLIQRKADLISTLSDKELEALKSKLNIALESKKEMSLGESYVLIGMNVKKSVLAERNLAINNVLSRLSEEDVLDNLNNAIKVKEEQDYTSGNGNKTTGCAVNFAICYRQARSAQLDGAVQCLTLAPVAGLGAACGAVNNIIAAVTMSGCASDYDACAN
ncbi:MAG: hypothetical protein ACJAWV_001037 [Flammeovirgaceae bacterium]|jgi:hypothetical protein